MSIKINQPMTRFGGWQVLGILKDPLIQEQKQNY